MPAKAALVALALLAGCSSPAEPPLPPGPGCSNAAAGVCFDALDQAVRLDGCMATGVDDDLTEEVYPLPPGFQPWAPTGASQQALGVEQRILMFLGKCTRLQAGGHEATDVTLGYMGLLAETPDAPNDGIQFYTLEVITDSEVLAAAFRAAGFPVVQASLQTEPGLGQRRDVMAGDVDYVVQSTYVPFGDGPGVVAPYIPGTETYHSPSAWAVIEDECMNYIASAEQSVTGTRGQWVKALGHEAPGNSGYNIYIDCSLLITFGQRSG